MCVVDLNELYSDVHSPINVIFKCSNQFSETVERNVNYDVPLNEDKYIMYVC